MALFRSTGSIGSFSNGTNSTDRQTGGSSRTFGSGGLFTHVRDILLKRRQAAIAAARLAQEEAEELKVRVKESKANIRVRGRDRIARRKFTGRQSTILTGGQVGGEVPTTRKTLLGA